MFKLVEPGPLDYGDPLAVARETVRIFRELERAELWARRSLFVHRCNQVVGFFTITTIIIFAAIRTLHDDPCWVLWFCSMGGVGIQGILVIVQRFMGRPIRRLKQNIEAHQRCVEANDAHEKNAPG